MTPDVPGGSPPPLDLGKGWCVRVSRWDDLVVSISERELAGRDISEDDAALIRGCAQHLLAFIGDPAWMARAEAAEARAEQLAAQVQKLEKTIFDVGEALDGQFPDQEPSIARAVQQQREGLDAAEDRAEQLAASVQTLTDNRDAWTILATNAQNEIDSLKAERSALRQQTMDTIQSLRVNERERLEDAYKLPHTSGQLRRQNVSNGYLRALDDLDAALAVGQSPESAHYD